MNTRRILILGALAVLGLGLAAPSLAAKVALQNATATWSQLWDGTLWYSAEKTIDGVTAGAYTSWAIFRGDVDTQKAETIVWETRADLTLNGSALLSFDLHHQEAWATPGHNLGRFRLSYTTDDRATFADGLIRDGDVTANWIAISPSSASSTGGELMTTLADTSILVSGGTNAHATYTVSSLLAVSGITGFRLEAMKDPSLPHGGPGRQSANGNFHLSEFVVNTIPEPASALLSVLGLVALAAGRHRFGASRS